MHPSSARCLLATVSLLVATDAQAVTITYVDAGPADARVFVGFDNDASGYATSDLVVDPSATSRNDTAYGPLPAPGDLPSFDATVYAAAELGTNLAAPLGVPPRSIFAPLNPSFFVASGQTLQPTGVYTSHAYAWSGPTTATAPTVWTVHVDASGAELPGQPVQVTVDASILGVLAVAGASSADAAWTVTTSEGGVISGAASLATPGSVPYSDASTLVFTTTLGSTFDLLVDLDLLAGGAGAGAASSAEITSALVTIDALALPSVAPLLTCSAVPSLWPPDLAFADVSGAFALRSDDAVDVAVRVLSDEPEDRDPDAIVDRDAVWVRRERRGSGDGRLYLLLVTATDASGGRAQGACVGGVVPHDRSSGSRDAVLQQATASLLRVEEALGSIAADDLQAGDVGLWEVGAGR